MSQPNNPKMDSFTTFLHDLPPLKRIRLIQQQQKYFSDDSSSPLPAKKRKESRTATSPSSPPATKTVHNYSLPAKKRVWAPLPQTPPSNDVVPAHFDLNVEYNPNPNLNLGRSEQGTEDDVECNPNPNLNLGHSEQGSEDDVEYKPNLNLGLSEQDSEDDGVLCCVCQSTDGDPTDPIVFCDGCDLMVHASCYGRPLSEAIPEEDWFCERCRFNERSTCALCPSAEGAMKRTETEEGTWAHVVCALFVPEVFFRDPEGREGIDFSKVPKKRWSEKCYVCGLRHGCALVCSEPKCGLGFHVTCAMKEELWIEYSEGKKGGTIVAGFCKKHTQVWEKQHQSGKYKIVAAEDEK